MHHYSSRVGMIKQRSRTTWFGFRQLNTMALSSNVRSLLRIQVRFLQF